MPRRGRTASPPPAQRRAASTSLPARTAPAATHPVPAASATPGVAQQPSMFQQMAATAGGVAVGSAIGHTVGAGITGLFSGGSNDDRAAAPAPAPVQQQSGMVGSQPNETQGPCAYEISQFLNCAQNQADITICEGFNEALRQCKQKYQIH